MPASAHTYREKVEMQLSRMDIWNPHVNAVMGRHDDAARRAADVADTAAADNNWLGLLHGVTIMVKDNIDEGLLWNRSIRVLLILIGYDSALNTFPFSSQGK